MWEIRAARAGDERGIAEVHVATWRHAYRGLLPAHVLDGLDVGAREAMWRQVIAQLDAASPARLDIAADDGRILGFASAGPARDDDAPRELELSALYLDPARHGAGIGRALVDAALADAPAYLWVLRGNDRAIAFYERIGFAFDGTEIEERRADHVRVERRMVR